MPNRREFLVTAAGATAAGVSAFVSAPALSREQPNPAENATAITQVYGDGMRLMGVSVEYRRPVHAVQIRASDYRVEGRTVNNVYVSRTPAGTPYRSGRYVVIELDPYDAGALLVQKNPPAGKGSEGNAAEGAGAQEAPDAGAKMDAEAGEAAGTEKDAATHAVATTGGPSLIHI